MPRPISSVLEARVAVPSVTAAITFVSFPTVEAAVLGRAVRGRPVPGIERGLDMGLLCG